MAQQLYFNRPGFKDKESKFRERQTWNFGRRALMLGLGVQWLEECGRKMVLQAPYVF